MARPVLALVVIGSFFALVMGVRVALHWRRTGHSGVLGLSGKPGSLTWWSGVLFTVAAVIAPLGCVLELMSIATTTLPAPGWTLAAGLALAAVGTAGTFAAQSGMGASWRVGVRASEKTALITTGLHAVVRNPIFTFMWIAMAGVALIAPSVFTIAGLLGFIAAVELQVRYVEEPYLQGAHGERYARYRSQVGRFFPRLTSR